MALSLRLPSAHGDDHHRRQLAVLARHERLLPGGGVQARRLPLARCPPLLGLRDPHEDEVRVALGDVQPARVVVVYDLRSREVETGAVVALDVARDLLVVGALLRVQNADGAAEALDENVHSFPVDVQETGATAQLGGGGQSGRRGDGHLVGAVARRWLGKGVAGRTHAWGGGHVEQSSRETTSMLQLRVCARDGRRDDHARFSL